MDDQSSPTFKISRRICPDYTKRPRTLPGPVDCAVFAYPSMGGVVMGDFTGLELEWLGFPRTIAYSERPATDSEDESSREKEDTFAFRMMQLGARWWPSRRMKEHHDARECPYGHHYPPDLHVGYPTNPSETAVVLLKTYSGSNLLRLPECDAPEKPDDWSRLAACGTMEERCAVLREFGAEEWGDLKDCTDIPQSLEDGVAEGKRYATLLRNMDDRNYRDKWQMEVWNTKTPGIDEESSYHTGCIV